MPDKRIEQMPLICAITEYLREGYGIETMLPREFNAVISAANMIVEELAKPEKSVTPNMGMTAWMASDHTGRSSMYMAWRLHCAAGIQAGTRPPLQEYAYPLDPDDLKRCIWLLDACPILRPCFKEMAKTGPEWAALIERWDELEQTLREELPSGSAPRTYALMQDVLTNAAKAV